MKHLPFYLCSGLLGGLLTITGCSDDADNKSPDGITTLKVQTVKDIPADADAVPGPPGQGPPPNYTFFSLSDGKTVEKADSNSAAWDIALAGTTILVNGGVSGPGQGEAQVVTGSFDELSEAPESGYQSDSDVGMAIPTGSGNGWYTYTGQDGTPPNTILPIPGRVVVLRTADGNYAKLEIMSYYRGNPDTSSANFSGEGGRHYTFRYVVQPNGSRTF